MVNEQTLSNKWWWRTLKVVYILVWLISISLLALIGYLEYPRQTPSNSWINIDCNKKENSVRIMPSLYFTSQNYGKFTNAEVEYVRKVCEYGPNKGDYTQFQSVLSDNYTVGTYLEKSGSWAYFPVGLLIVSVLIETIKTIVLYIMGISIWRGILLYGLMFISDMLKGDKKERSNG